MLIYHFQNPRALENYTKSTLPVFYKWSNKALMTVMFTTWFTENFKPTFEIYYSDKKIPFKTSLLNDNAPGYPRALMEMYNEINAVSMPATYSAAHGSRSNFNL